MKTKVFFLAGILIAVVASGQHPTFSENENVFPTFTSGKSTSLNDFLHERLQYPSGITRPVHQGTVIIGFIVTSTGELKDFTVINSVSPKCDREVIRTLKHTKGRWIPGQIEGKPVDMQQEVAVIFKLYPKDNFIASAKKYLHKGNQKLFMENQPKRALAFFNRGIKFLPNDMTLLAIRSLCKQRMGDAEGASRDLERIAVLAERNGSNLNLDILGDMVKDSEDVHGFDEFRRGVEKSPSVAVKQ